jgi:predicted metalloprotease
MRIEGREESENVEDRRGVSPGGIAITGGAGTLLLMLIVWLLGGNPLQLLQQLPQQPGQVGQPIPGGALPPGQEELTHYVKVVLRDTEVVWDELFRQRRLAYRYPKLVLFTGRVDSACGLTSAAVGPFYCPEDERVYLDLGFYRELKDRFGASGDFAQAYVIAHEIGHHVQKILGISDKVAAARERAGQREGNQLSVRLELQADFFAGVWANHAQQKFKSLEPGDIEEALRCANAIGDDNLQKQARGVVVPDSFTHGTSAQRMKWFMRGFTTGDMSQGDTFSANDL